MSAAKTVKACLAAAVVFVWWNSAAYAGPSLWPNSRGEFCLENVSRGEMARIAVVRTVGNNYLVQGVTEESSGSTTLFSGNAIVDGGWVIIHLTSSGFAAAAEEIYGALSGGWSWTLQRSTAGIVASACTARGCRLTTTAV